MQNTTDYLSHRAWYALAAASVLCYIVTACWLTDSTPKFDDLNDAFGFFKQLALAQSPLQKIGAFFYPNNEHVTAFNHLIYFVQFQFLGELNFYYLTLIGHGIIIATGLLLACSINSERKPFFCAIFALGYIQLYYWDSSFKAMTALSNQAVILFAVASFYCLARKRSIILALLFAGLAQFSQGNGALIWPIGAIILWCDPALRAQRYRHLALWFGAALLAISLYAWARHTYGNPSPLTAALIIQQLKQHFTLPFLAAIAFLGSTVFPTINITLALMVGAAVWCAALWWLWRYRQHDWLITALLLFFLASAVTAGVMRGLVAGAEGALESRYKMYSMALMLLLGCLLLEYRCTAQQRRYLASVLLLIALGIQITAFRFIPAITSQAERFQASYRTWLEDGDFKRQAVYFPPMSDHFLFVAEHLHLFNFMQFIPKDAILPRLSAASGRTCPPTPALADHCPLTLRHRGNAVLAAIDVSNALPALPATLTLCDDQNHVAVAFVIPAKPTSSPSWFIPEVEIPAGHYRALLQPAQQALCAIPFTKKSRKVKAEMRTLFREAHADPGQPD
jgi:hypothetical protein